MIDTSDYQKHSVPVSNPGILHLLNTELASYNINYVDYTQEIMVSSS